MEGYTKIKFACESHNDIQEMYQFLWGECYLYLDSMVTWDEKDARNDASEIVEVITAFFEMLKVWLEIIPTLVDFYPYMKKYSYLYLTCPEAAILNLSKSFETTLNVIFGYSPRSEEFMRTSSNILSNSKVLSKPKTKKIALVS